MDALPLSTEATRVIETAEALARKRRHADLDGIHLFYTLTSLAYKGESDPTRVSEIPKLLDALLQQADAWSTPGDYPEPTEVYLKILLSAQEAAIADAADEITPTHLFTAVMAQDQRLVEWLNQQQMVIALSRPAAPTLERYGRDLTALARNGKVGPVVGRQAEVRQVVEVLLQRGKHNALLLGEAGVGKTAVVERLALDIAAGLVPEKLKTACLIEISLGDLVAGTTFRGQFEERIQGLLDELRERPEVILVIDEFHTIVGAGTTIDGGPDAANMLKPALARGEIACIGITTRAEFARHIENDAALTRRFHPIIIEEPSLDETLKILTGLAPAYIEHHNLSLQPGVLEAIVHWTERHQPARRFPDKAIDLLGKAAARAELQGLHELTPALVAEVLSETAGVPVGELEIGMQHTLASLETLLGQQVIGQTDAIRVLSRAVRLSYIGLRDPRKSRGVFLFIGPSGVGKTELARRLAQALFGSEKALIRLDMSEYSEPISLTRLIGAAPGYVGHEEPGQLSQPLREQPHAVILLDEIEKAHSEVFNLLLQLFDEGRLTDSHGRVVDGRSAIFIMTSNLGVDWETRRSLGFLSKSATPGTSVNFDALNEFFRPEFINRIDHVIRFRELDLDDLIQIAQMETDYLSARLNEQGIRLEMDDMVLPLVARRALEQQGGARGIKRTVEYLLAEPISDLLLASPTIHQRTLFIRTVSDHVDLEWGK